MTVPDTASAAPETILSAAIAAVARMSGADHAITELLSGAAGAVGADRAAAVVWDDERGSLALAGMTGYTAGEAADFATAITGSTDHPVARTAHGQTAVLGAESRAADGRVIVSATLPLRVAANGVDEPLGALSVSRPGPWTITSADAAMLAAFADLIAIAIDRERLTALAEERTDWQERMAHTDALTGLANARTLSRVLELEVARAGRQGTDLSIALFDVDGLAGANAAGGPAVGDDILREVAAVLTESIRLVDTVARWGGDEFLVVAPGSAGMTVAKRVLDALATRPAIGGHPISVSAGIARFPVDGASTDDLISAAERALATAKASGPGTLSAVAGA